MAIADDLRAEARRLDRRGFAEMARLTRGLAFPGFPVAGAERHGYRTG